MCSGNIPSLRHFKLYNHYEDKQDPELNLAGLRTAESSLTRFVCVSLQKEVRQKKTRICFVLLSAPWSVLCYYAEEISLRVPLQVKHLLTSSQEAVRYLLTGQKPSPQGPNNHSCLWYYKVSQRLFKFFSFIQSSPIVFPSCRCHQIHNKCLEKSMETIKACAPGRGGA